MSERAQVIDWLEFKSNKSRLSETRPRKEFIRSRYADVFRRTVKRFVLLQENEFGLLVVLCERDWYLFSNLVICLEADAREKWPNDPKSGELYDV